ncbi:MAG: SEL1-like repeat protein [Bacteroidaceae bacterium]|nr:SEL1-like repeat protein [Bacteroidaceae bacterium]
MALVKCNNCGHMVSDKADVCPKCGASVTQTPVEAQPQQEAVSNNPQKSKRKGVFLACIVAVLLVVGGGAAWYFHGGDKPSKSVNDHPIYSEELRKKAEAGDAVAQCDLGICYGYGYGIEQNFTEAVQWHQKAANQGMAEAQYYMGNYYEFGNGVSQSYTEAVKWYRMAANQGHKYAQNNLGSCLYDGRGIQQNYSEAVRFFLAAAEQGLDRAQCSLGICYENGIGVSQDYAEAVKWYRKSAEQGYARGELCLGLCYDKGNGVSQDHTEAVKWYKSAVEKGDGAAMYYLGICYGYGYGVEKNQDEADRLYKMSAETGFQPAIDFLNGGSSTLQTNDVNTTWDYFQDTDDLTGNVTAVNAALSSTNAVEYDNYGHTSKLFILLTYSAKGETQITIGGVDATGSEKMRFSDFQGSGFLAVFDDGEVDDTWRYIGMSERRTSLYIHHTHEVAEFVSKLKASRTCKIQVNLEHGGKKTFTFNTAGLKWDY